MLSSSLWSIAAFAIGVAADCNPLTTNGCAAIPGLASSSYSVDFTQQKSLPKDWVLADASNVTFGSNGVQFNFNNRKQAPYIWTNFYVAYGKIDVVMQVAGGTGVITSAVMFSDDADEIDWEFSGSNLGAGVDKGKAQTNVFGKGMTGNYDRGTVADVSPTPQTSFHTYTINWTPDKIDWILDGNTIRTENNNGQKSGNYQFPQTPSRLHLGVWDAGDPDTAAGTRHWAGGLTDYSKVPYVAYVKSVKITTPYPCKAWKYPDNFSGSWADVKCSNDNIPTTSARTTSTSAAPKSTEATYTVVKGDNGYAIADKLGCTFDQLKSNNPDIKWDFLDIGQKLKNPNAGASGATQSPGSGSGSGSIPTSRSSSSSSSKLNSTSRSTSSSSSSSRAGAGASASSSASRGLNPTIGTAKSTTTATSKSSVSTTKQASSSSYTCIPDACYNSMTMTQFITSALSFCSDYKTGTVATPTFLSGCASDYIRVKSACGCLTKTFSTTNRTTSSSSLRSTSSTILSTSKTTSTSTSTSNTTKTISTTTKTTSTPATTTAATQHGWAGWNWGNYGGWEGWRGWKRDKRSNKSKAGAKKPSKHTNGHKHGRFGGGRQHV